MYQVVEIDNHFENPFFIGTVEDNKDPTSNYRVKVRIDLMHPSTISTEQLPWAAKLDSSFMGMDSSSTLHSIPEVGSKVLVLAVGNDINSLVYLGCLYKKTDSTPGGDDYLNTYGIYDKNGNFIGVDKINTVLKLIYKGKIDISKITEAKISIDGPVNITTTGDINVETSSSATVKASMTKILGGPVTIEKGTVMGFNCLSQCILTGARHVSNISE